MTPRIPKLLLSFAALVALSCGARSTLDLLEEDEDATGGSGSTAATGGRGGAGGTAGQTGGPGGMMMTGGTLGTGGKTTTGGTIGTGGKTTTGGTLGTGGKTTTGGTTGTGGTGGIKTGGISGAGGIKTGGTIGTGGMKIGGTGGGTIATGGSGGTGGVTKTGGTIGTGGTPATGGSLGTGGSKCPSPASNEDLIDNLDDGDRYIPLVNGRIGAWKDGNDGTPGGIMYPDPAVGFTPTDSGDACYGYSAYVKGLGFVDWGANLQVGLGSPYDASKYVGITFWARVDSGTKNVINVAFPDNDTHPDGGICKTGATACWDNFSLHVTLSSTWKKYTIYFKETTQGGWGNPAPALDPSSLYEIIFDLPVNSTFSLWIDDLAFFW